MGIDVYWKNENGQVLGSVLDSGILTKMCNLLDRQSSSICLRFIDPAGDACFNQLQLPLLLTEFYQLQAAVSGPRAKSHVEKIVRLLESAVQVHTYIWFIGD